MSTDRSQLDRLQPRPVQRLETSLESVPHVRRVTVEIGSSCALLEHDGAERNTVLVVLREDGFAPRAEITNEE